LLSNWVALTYTASDTAPSQDPADGRRWYYSAIDQVDIMIQNNGSFVGYRTVSNDVRGFNLTQTDPAGPIVAASAPTEQSDGTALVQGDIWIDTSNLELYPLIYRWQEVDGVLQWVVIDNTDQTTENGILFADARWAPNGTTNPITDAIPTITSLLSSSYLDLTWMHQILLCIRKVCCYSTHVDLDSMSRPLSRITSMPRTSLLMLIRPPQLTR
jgi:hypothetical protein